MKRAVGHVLGDDDFLGGVAVVIGGAEELDDAWMIIWMQRGQDTCFVFELGVVAEG